jgi:hypothetical protein
MQTEIIAFNILKVSSDEWLSIKHIFDIQTWLQRSTKDFIQWTQPQTKSSQFIDISGNCKLPSMPSCTGLSRIQHFKWKGKILNFETSADVFIFRLFLKSSMWQVSAIPWKVVYTWSPNKKCVCLKRENKRQK